jgi:hypothetical protein
MLTTEKNRETNPECDSLSDIMQATATKTRGAEAVMTAEFLMTYLMAVNQLNEDRSRVESARNDQERRKSLLRLQNVSQRCRVLQSLVFPRES